MAWAPTEAPNKRLRKTIQTKKRAALNAERLTAALDRMAPLPPPQIEAERAKPIRNFDRILKRLRGVDDITVNVNTAKMVTQRMPPPRSVVSDAKRIIKFAKTCLAPDSEFGTSNAADAALFQQLDDAVAADPLCDPNFWAGGPLEGDKGFTHETCHAPGAPHQSTLPVSSQGPKRTHSSAPTTDEDETSNEDEQHQEELMATSNVQPPLKRAKW